MPILTKNFPDGTGNVYVEYSGKYNNIVSISADPNESENEREVTLTFNLPSTGETVERRVVQAGSPVQPYVFDMSLITNSNRNVAVQMGIQNGAGNFVNTAWSVQGNSGYSGTSAANYWTNGTTEHIYNASVSKANLGDNIFYVNAYNNTANITSANISTTMPLINMAYCFNNCRNLTSIEGEGVCLTNMAYTFYNCNRLTSLDGIANWNVASVTNMVSTFNNCSNLTSLEPLAKWNTGNVTSMANIFYNCCNLTSLDPLTNWNTGNVTNMYSTFDHCNNLISLNGLANWDTSNVTSMGFVFYNCQNLISLNGLANWDTSNVTSMGSAFYNCHNITNVDGLANWDTSNVTSMGSAFYNCQNFTSLEPLANWNVAKVTSMYQMFYNCRNVKTHGFNNWTGASANCANMFRYCNSLDDMQIHWNITCAADMFANRNTSLNVYASTNTNAYNALYMAMGNATTNSNWNITLYELNE